MRAASSVMALPASCWRCRTCGRRATRSCSQAFDRVLGRRVGGRVRPWSGGQTVVDDAATHRRRLHRAERLLDTENMPVRLMSTTPCRAQASSPEQAGGCPPALLPAPRATGRRGRSARRWRRQACRVRLPGRVVVQARRAGTPILAPPVPAAPGAPPTTLQRAQQRQRGGAADAGTRTRDDGDAACCCLQRSCCLSLSLFGLSMVRATCEAFFSGTCALHLVGGLLDRRLVHRRPRPGRGRGAALARPAQLGLDVLRLAEALTARPCRASWRGP